MGEVRKIGDEYFIEFYARGLLYQQKAGHDLNFAKKFLEDVEGKIKNGEMGTIVREVDWDIFCITFLEFAQKNHTLRSFKRYQDLITHFSKFIQVRFLKLNKISEVTPFVIEEYRVYLIQAAEARSPKIKSAIINFTLLLLKDILEYAIKLGYLNDNPALHARWLESKSNRKLRILSEESIGDFVAGLDAERTERFVHLEPKVIEMARLICDLPKENNLVRENFGINIKLWLLIRNNCAIELLNKGVSLIQLYRMLGFFDVLKVMRYFEYWTPPLSKMI